jgi:hypothetical protein
MKTTDTTNYIRQQQVGQFRIPEDGKGPFARVNGQTIGSTKGQENTSIYLNTGDVVALDKTSQADASKIIDFDVGVKFSASKISTTKNEEKSDYAYTETGKVKITTKPEEIIDQWA